MKKNTINSILFFVLMLCSLSITAQGVLPSNDIFRLKNVATGQFLTDAGASATPVTMTNLGEEEQSTHFKFVESGAYYNIDSEILGILRAPGAGGPGGPYVVVSTTKAAPAADTDKTWTIDYNSTNDTYRFGSRTTGRFMYHEVDGTVTHVVAPDTDDRSNWELVPYVQTPVVVAPDEDTSTDLTCPASGEFENNSTRNVDLPNPVNVGTVDDRTCYSDYSEFDVYGKTWGVYNITDGSNHWDAPNTLQPRIERSLDRSGETGVGSYARLTGTFRILEVGDAGSFSQDGTYIAQAKGKHSGGGGSPDPAICLYLARPVMGTGINAGKQVAFDIYAERILVRGGEGSGREEVFLKQVNKNEEINFELEVGFREDPSDPTKKIHYCDAVIGGDAFNWNIPEPERGLESGIRYGAYRVKGGRAQIRWANTTYQKVEVAESGDAPEGNYKLKNVATGKYLMDPNDGSIIASDSGVGSDKEWQFVSVPATSYYNIDSQGPRKIIRFTGVSDLICTNFSAPNSDTDKLWNVIDNGDGSYSFETRNLGKYLYHAVDNTIIHSANIDDRSKWILESATLSISEAELNTSSIKVYPNPADNKFTIAFQNITGVKDIEIYNILGKLVYKNSTNSDVINVAQNNNLPSGIYLVRAKANDNSVYNSKLVIK